MPNSEFSQTFSDALVSELKAEMKRQDMSSRALGRLICQTSQYMSDRLDGGSSKTGRRVTLNARDLFAMSRALDLDLSDLIQRAEDIAETTHGSPDELALAASDDEVWESRQEAEAE